MRYKIYGEDIEQGALEQFYEALRQDFVVRGALMPDAHLGYSLPIGGVVATNSVLVPAWVGYDIGCGMCALRLDGIEPAEVRRNASRLFADTYDAIPCGKGGHHQKPIHPIRRLPGRTEIADAAYAKRDGARQLGTLGGGNHFIEIGEDEQENVWIIIHSGSRGVGWLAAYNYMALAAGSDEAKEGHYALDAESTLGRMYRVDLNHFLEYALLNRETMLRLVVDQMGPLVHPDWESLINRNHNHAVLEHGMWIHRKGATHAEAGMMGVIPGNMRDGSFIVRGKGCEDSLWSSSHGAGRVLGRKAAKRTLQLEDFTAQMKGIVAKVEGSTLDESPGAYKDIFEVMAAQQDLVEVIAHVRPILNVKG